ncbi:MAG: polymer-forming cytoskeletal protein [Rhodospirillales bacterium]|nr:polymer-forming cytoskeletal protein [Rhodospirillales bacterium]
MFSRASKAAPQAAPAKKGMPSIIAGDFRVTGDVVSDGDIQLDGTVHGNVRTHTLTVGESGAVHGEIIAEAVRVLGKVCGPIRAKSVELARTAHVVGDIRHETLTIDTGAFIDGHCKRLDGEPVRSEERLALVHNLSTPKE